MSGGGSVDTNDMDLVESFSGLQQAKVASQIQTAVAVKIMSQQKAEGAAAVQLLQAATKGFNQAGDELVAQATGLGGTLDTYA
jgi:hypothetical protein